ncbi:hypothetical protein C5167_020293 [Papaver somniferum]|uniref:Uncharacterized protein n=1 Tax=Papaver somniferum TaxID=3469 RepID=A0A4Y7IVX4_PAPSO|nr:hypothetical protein C5167_020293 [Papaver somniferum]
MASANAIAGLTAAMAAQLVWTPIDIFSQRLMVQGGIGGSSGINKNPRYSGQIDASRKIVRLDGVRGLYRGFGMSTVTYVPIFWASYSISQRVMWGGYSCYLEKKENGSGGCVSPSAKTDNG